MADIDSSVRYAANNSPGLYSSQIGWFDYSPYTARNPFSNNTTYSVVNTISNPPGYKISFNLTINQSFPPGEQYIPIASFQNPVYPTSVFGHTAYLGINGHTLLDMVDNASGLTTTTITLSNIIVTDINNVPITNYEIIAADGESTNSSETWQVTTNGTPWSLLQIFPPINSNPSKIHMMGLGTDTFEYVGTTLQDPPSVSLSTTSPTIVTAVVSTVRGKQSVTFGIIISSTIQPSNGPLTRLCSC